MVDKAEKTTVELVQSLRDTLDRLAVRAFYWLRLEGEARKLSPVLGRRIAECLDSMLVALAGQDFAPVARFMAQEQERVGEASPEERLLQTVALLDACERSLAEGLQANRGTAPSLAILNSLHSLTHQARRQWLHLCSNGSSNGNSHKAPQERALSWLASLGRDIESATNLDELVDRLFPRLLDMIPHEDGQLLLWGNRQEPLVRTANSRLFVGHGGAVDGYSNWVAFQRTPLLVSDSGSGPDHPETPAYSSYLGVPLLQGERLVGTLALVSTQANSFSQADLDMLNTLAPAVSAAIQRVVPEAGLVEDLQRRLQEQNILLTFGRELNAAMEEGRIYSLLLFKAMELTDSDAGAVLTVDSKKKQYDIQALSGYASDVTAEDALMATQSISWDVGIVGWVARTGQTALVPDVSETEDYMAVRPETRSQLTVPIIWQGETVGVLNLESSSLNAYNEAAQLTAETLADHAAVAIGTTRLFHAIQEQRQWLSSLISNLPEGIIVVDDEMQVALANPASTHLLGLDRSLAEGTSLKETLSAYLTPFLHAPAELDSFLQRAAALDRGLTESWIEFKDATRRLWLVAAPLWSEGGHSSGHVILVRDARQDENSEREKLGFLSIVSHELRSPLTSIMGYSELLLNRKFKADRQQEFVQIIFGQAQHLSQLVEDVINLSRLSRGRMKLNRSNTTFYQIVASMATQLDGQMSSRHSLLFDVPPDLPPFYMDRDKIRVILNNLIGNAVKYSPDGGEVVLKAELIATSDQAQELKVPTTPPFLLISVQDHGIGIPEEALPHIFERFYRADNTSTRQIGGTGLGLAITQALVELHGGTIWVKSTLNQGSTFCLTLPIRERTAEEPRDELEGEGEGSNANAGGG